MHIPENYLSPETCAVMALVAVPTLCICVKKVRQHMTTEKLPLLGIGAALSFLLMMFNIPVPGGTSAHAVGAVLLSALLGPLPAVVCVSAALILQALLFGDGGVLTLGANIFNMAIAMPLIGYGVYHIVSKRLSPRIALGLGAYIGLNVAALLAAIEFGVQPLLYTDAAGLPLYCPYPLSISIPAMLIPHLTVAGAAEVLFSVGIYSFIINTHGEIRYSSLGETRIEANKVYLLLLVLIVLCPLGLLTSAGAWGEWGPDEISEVVTNGQALGFTPKGMVTGFTWPALMSDYGISGMQEILGYLLSAIIGVAVLILVFKLFFSTSKAVS